ncbi:hypothetical protein TNCV_1434081 [Trichonephila clavipes]|nr:hypothetical protein TNCV_1434081 [Trichonephila clavipes]
MPSPVKSNCDAHDTIANGQYGAVWSMGHTQQVCVRIVLLPPQTSGNSFSGDLLSLRQQETDLPPAELYVPIWCDFCGRSIPVVKVTDSCLASHEFEPSSSEAPLCRGGRCALNMLRLKRPPVGVVGS